MPLGDSITQADTDHSSYRRPLWQLLTQGGYSVDFVGSTKMNDMGSNPTPDFDLDHEGHWGYRADQISSNITAWATANVPDIVLLHIGTNDLLQGQSVSSTITDIDQIITKLRAVNAQVVVLVAQILPYSGTGSSNVPSLNSSIATLASSKTTAQSPVVAVDMYTGFVVSTMTSDNVHPNTTGEAHLANRWYAALLPYIGASSGTATPSATVLASATSTRTATRTPTRTATRTNTNVPGASQTATPTNTVGAGGLSFYRAVNLGGAALTIDGNAWEANTGTTPNLSTNGAAMCNQWVPLTPTTDASRTSMIQCSRQHWAHNLVMSAVPNGVYQVSLYTWLDWADPNPGAFSVQIEGATVLPSYTPGPVGKWSKLGPFTVTISDGTINVTTNGGLPNLSGIEVWRFTGATPTPPVTIIASSTSTSTATATATATATSTVTMTPSNTATTTATNTATVTATATATASATDSVVPSATQTDSATATETETATTTTVPPTATATATATRTATKTASPRPFYCGWVEVTGFVLGDQTFGINVYNGSDDTLSITAAELHWRPNQTASMYPERMSLSTQIDPLWVKPVEDTPVTSGSMLIDSNSAGWNSAVATINPLSSVMWTVTFAAAPNPLSTEFTTADFRGTQFTIKSHDSILCVLNSDTLPTYTPSATVANTNTATATATETTAASATPTLTPTRTASATYTASVTFTPSRTWTPTFTRTATNTATPSATSTSTSTATATPTSGGGGLTFYRAVNLGGAAVVIDGNAWEANTGTTPNLSTNGAAMCNQWVPLTPTTDASRTTMIQCARQHWAHNLVMSAVPNGTYQVSLYTWLDWADPNPGAFSVAIEGTTVVTSYTPGPVGKWSKFGPFTVTISDGAINVTTNGGLPNLSGIEVWSIGAGGSTTATATSTATATRTPTNTLSVSSTPSSTPTVTRTPTTVPTSTTVPTGTPTRTMTRTPFGQCGPEECP
ncbi:MAG: hypothetical protein KF726_19525 [Anaerolineae bacterium]|nr:hypothetical protein [Anaerolineae bacterium]